VEVVVNAAELLDEGIPAVRYKPVVVAQAGIRRAGVKRLQSLGDRVEPVRRNRIIRKGIAHEVAVGVLVQRVGIIDPRECGV
jgi:hypothetical protein